MMQSTAEMRQPKFGGLRLRVQLVKAPYRDADFVEQRGAVDLLNEIDGVPLLEGGRNGLERGERRSERGRAEAAVAVIVARDARLRRRDGAHVPMEIEERLLDVRKTHALSNLWHSSSD